MSENVDLCAMGDGRYVGHDGTTYCVIDGVVRSEIPKRNGQYRERHPNGALAMEFTMVERIPTGTMREWHDNGVVARETPYAAGLVHGTVRQWNREGKLLGEYTMTYGRGIARKWNEDGSLQTEYEQVSEKAVRGVVWDDLGKPRQVFLWNGKPISKRKFLERIAKDTEAG